MIGTIIGDIVGSRFEWNNIKTKEFEFIASNSKLTDDTVMTCAIGKAYLDTIEDKEDYNKKLADAAVKNMQLLGKEYPNVGYGGTFKNWLKLSNPQPYNSYGNGAVMRLSGIFNPLEDKLESLIDRAIAVTSVTHNHEESIKAVKALSTAMYLANKKMPMSQIRKELTAYYDLNFTLDSIRPTYKFDVSCQGSVPQAIEAFLESISFEDAIRNAISIGGDSDTIAAITGSIAEWYYEIPNDIVMQAKDKMTDELLEIVNNWENKFIYKN